MTLDKFIKLKPLSASVSSSLKLDCSYVGGLVRVRRMSREGHVPQVSVPHPGHSQCLPCAAMGWTSDGLLLR